MSRRKKILIWLICLSPFYSFILLMYFVKMNTISENLTEGESRVPGVVYFSDIDNPQNNLSTIIYSSDGVILGEYYKENRSNTNYSDLSPVLIDALISTEDIRFRSHSGIDVRSLFRAIYGIIKGSSSSGGASTLSQQLSKMLFTGRPSTGLGRIKQKLKEWVVAVELEKRYSKNEILSMYLNRFDWINQAVGITSASKIYFNTKPNTLDINQSAMLVGMLKNPSLYNPKRNPKGTQNRRNVVLAQMMKYKKITKREYDSLKTLPLNLDFQKVDHNEGLAPYFREQLRFWMKEWCSKNKKPNGEHFDLYTDGLIIHTTIDSRIQKHAEAAVKKKMAKLQEKFYKHWRGYSKAPYPEDFSRKQIDEIIYQGIKRSERYRKLKNQGKSKKEIDKIFNIKVNTTLFSWKGEIDTLISPRDSVIYNKFFIHTGLMSMSPTDGYIKAYVGGINHKFFKYDHVIKGKRQVGSTFKPFLYSLAIQEGMGPCDKILNSPVVFDKDKWGLEKDWIPYNSSTDFDGLSLSLKFGLANSINIMTAYIMHQFGPKPVVDMARKMGVTSYLQAVPSICLGTFDLSVKEITGAYSTFVNKGVYTEPIFVTKIKDKNGVVLENFQSEKNEALSEETAAIMVKLLQGAVDGVYDKGYKERSIELDKWNKSGVRGTARNLRYEYDISAEMGGKTGTTQNYSDGWYVGITPNLVTSVWTGCEDRSAHFRGEDGYGGNTALTVFGQFMKNVYEDDNISEVTQEDLFEFADVKVKNWVENKMNCNQLDLLNPEQNIDDEEF
ncbi:MAG: penicillin-binding protein [Flavobacteriales bacterium]|nr:penicillin-binding protein [Flavobacteriales bacterium]|tara:strand:+ start:6563 stop:8905 length:2343 start_codon:yes stop_codon:yes gene_type:complete